MSVGLSQILVAGIAIALLVLAVVAVLLSRLRDTQALARQEREAREATMRHDRETGAALRASTEREELLLANIDEFVFRARPVGDGWTVDFVSGRVTDVLGYSPAELATLGTAVVHPDDLPNVNREARRGFTEPGTHTFRCRLRHQNGDYRWFESRVRAVSPAVNEGPMIFGVVRDISEQLAAEEALRQSREALQQAQKMEALGRLAGGVAHDFNNLLTTMGGNASMVLDHLPVDDPHRGLLTEIVSASERAQRFTRQLLAFSRKQVLALQPIDISDVVAHMQSLLTRMIGPDHWLETSVAGPIPIVDADPGQIEQVVMNLVVNARDAMPTGGVIHLRLRASAPGDAGVLKAAAAGTHAVLEVEDAGVGIPTDLQERIFEPFFTTKDPGKGTGLGLSTIYGFVRQSGGHIDLQSSPQRGSRFRVFLPARGEAAPITDQGVLAGAPATPQPNGASPTVLVVDDEPGVRHLASAMLRRAGYDVVEAKDGLDAQRVSESHDGHIDVLLTDIVMPGARGPELADQLRAQRPEIRVIYMSGFRDTSALTDVDRGEALFLPKPFVRSALLGAIRRATSARRV
jgi:PAS domain S-box-containing protein